MCVDRIHVLDGERLPREGKATSTHPLRVPGLGPGRRRSGAHRENRTHPLLHARYLLEVRRRESKQSVLQYPPTLTTVTQTTCPMEH